MMVRLSRPLTLFLLLVGSYVSAQGEYKKFERLQAEENFITISLINKQTFITLFGKDTSHTYNLDPSYIGRSADELSVQGTPFLNRNGLVLHDTAYPVDLIDQVETYMSKDSTRVNFLKKSGPQAGETRIRKRNMISTFDDIVVEPGDFVRGSVISFWANITVEGEINEHIIAIFGNIAIGDKAVVRGDVIAVNGQVTISKTATIYGKIESSGYKKRRLFDRWALRQRQEKDFSPAFRFYYNRVDGATPYLGIQFADEDSLLPEIDIFAGYGFSSEQWRYKIDLEQSFFLSHPLTIGGTIYKSLRSGDDWIISDGNNTVFALLATEDYKDYYQTDGGYGFLRFTPRPDMSMEAGFLFEKYDWLEAHTDLWSLFGGSKRFQPNFASVGPQERDSGINQIERGELKSLRASAKFDNRSEDDIFARSFWGGLLEMEWLPDDWNDDYGFTRYRLFLRRFQTINPSLGLSFESVYGGSSGTLPLHRKFFLGGLGTLPGYAFKEYMGEEFWLAKTESRICIPRTDFTGRLFYDVGQIAVKGGHLSETEVKHSIGIGISFEDRIRLDIARRLDRSGSEFKLLVTLGLNF